MHSGYGIPGIQQHQQNMIMENHENSSVLLSAAMNQSHNQQLPTTTQQLFHLHQQHTMNHHHFLPIISNPNNHHHYMAAASAAGAFYPAALNFKLGLSEIRTSTTNYNNSGSDHRDIGTVSNSINNEDGAGGGLVVHGSERYHDDDDDEVVLAPEARHCNTSLETPHYSWQNLQDSSIKQQHQPRFWEPLPCEVSNENSEIVDRLDNIEMNHKPRTIVYGELEAIYKRLGTKQETDISETPNAQLPSEASIEKSDCLKDCKRAKKKRKRKERSSDKELGEFFEKLVKQVVEHQENLHAKFAEVIERLDGERREREEAWRSRELAYLEQQVAARVHERACSASRDEAIVSYLEKIAGAKINLPPLDRYLVKKDRSPGS